MSLAMTYSRHTSRKRYLITPSFDMSLFREIGGHVFSDFVLFCENFLNYLFQSLFENSRTGASVRENPGNSQKRVSAE